MSVWHAKTHSRAWPGCVVQVLLTMHGMAATNVVMRRARMYSCWCGGGLLVCNDATGQRLGYSRPVETLPFSGHRARHRSRLNARASPFLPPPSDLDHTNPVVRDGIVDWLNWLHQHVGFEGWRFDFVKVRRGKAAWLKGRARQKVSLKGAAMKDCFGGWRFDFVKVRQNAGRGAAGLSGIQLPSDKKHAPRHCRIGTASNGAYTALVRPFTLPFTLQGYHPRFTAEYIERTLGPEAFCVGENFVDLRW